MTSSIPRSHKRQRQRELAEARARLVAHLQEVIGSALTAETAEQILQQARAWSGLSARRLDEHITQHPDALTAPSPHCPAALVRLLRQFAAAGHGEAVTQLGCARCGRSDRSLERRMPEGRCCQWCVNRDVLRRCARCGQDGHIATRREEGPICRRCYRKDPLLFQECAGCGQQRLPAFRRDDGTALCSGCAPRPKRECVGCGRQRPAAAFTENGPLCTTCYTAPPQLCGVCGEIAPLSVRATGEQPAVCVRCYRGVVDECVVCGRRRHGRRVRDRAGAFHCHSCGPRPSRPCVECGRNKPVRAAWPVGDLCDTCYQRRRRNPGRCSRCGQRRVLVGRADDGGDLCGPCSGLDNLNPACRRCGFPGDIYADGSCTRCVVGDRVRDLLAGDDGNVPPQLRPLADALIAAELPSSIRKWLRTSPAARLLATLASRRTPITHELLDDLPQGRDTRYVRELLVATAILPRRQENFARLQLWVRDTLAELPLHQKRIIGPFAEWNVLRDARRRAARGRYTSHAATADRVDIRTAIKFMDWLDTKQINLGELTQQHIDQWLTERPSGHRGTRAFIRWTVARQLTTRLAVPPRKYALPSRFLSEDEHHQQLRRCLNDDSLPLEVRIVGALIRLYALPTPRILQLTTDRFHRDDDGAYLTLDRNPVLLPPKLARLIEQQIARPRRTSSLQQQSDNPTGYLLPGRPTSRPRSTGAMHSLMNKHDLPVISARNTAMIEIAAELPPIVISDLFGVHPGTAHAWAQYTQDSWADYLAACEKPHNQT